MLELVLRVVFSLAVVLGLLWILARASSRRLRGGTTSPVQVVARQPLGRSTSLQVVSVGQRLLVIGVAESQVSLLTELDPADVLDEQSVVTDTPVTHRQTTPGAVGGSLLSPRTWRRAYTAVTRRGNGES
ncbi:MAG TPA: flagellar biosynthetic protein FliO [Nocardioidaceae bacterium]|nr:flagellar biosynthetic protein FliO [Nocardioidaceae bacterium]